jgi:hypothetical protein
VGTIHLPVAFHLLSAHRTARRTIFGQTLVFRALEADPTLVATFDEAHLDARARALGPDVVEFWESVKKAAWSQTSDDQPSKDA